MKVVFVTGASRGIGLATAQAFHDAGYIVIGTYHMTQLDRPWEMIQLDVTNVYRVKEVVTQIIEEHGKIDVLVNNAGVADDATLKNMQDKQWQKVLRVNLDGCYHVTSAVVPHNPGCIINVSSVAGIAGNIGQTNYAASKAGIIGFSKSLAREVARRGIRVNVVAPGLIETDMTNKLSPEALARIIPHIPLQRIGKPEEVACMIKFLASEDASYITGQVFNVDGGLL